MNVAVFGLGKLGLPLVAALASKGHKVIGTDKDEQRVSDVHDYYKGSHEGLDEDYVPVTEPGVASALVDNFERVEFTKDSETAVVLSDVVFVVVPTPSKLTGEFSTEHVTETAETIGNAMRDETRYILIVLVSTVMLGDTAKFVAALEKHSGRLCGDSFGVCYNPEFVALGSVLHDLLNPDFVLIGESNEKAGSILEDLYRSLQPRTRHPVWPIRRMNFANAEIAKLALNCYITMKISYANLLGNLCEEIPGANAHVVTDAIGLDCRVGKAYLKPATAYGGPCFPRDVKAFNTLAESISPELSDLFRSVQYQNEAQTGKLVDLVEEYSSQEAKVAVLGLAYKPGTHVTEESVGLDLIRLLQNRGREVVAWDPMVTKTGIALELDEALLADSLEDCVKDVDVVIVTTPCEEFEKIPIPLYQSDLAIVIDPWGIVEWSDSCGFVHIRPGICQKESER